jgi:hypothetical protein
MVGRMRGRQGFRWRDDAWHPAARRVRGEPGAGSPKSKLALRLVLSVEAMKWCAGWLLAAVGCATLLLLAGCSGHDHLNRTGRRPASPPLVTPPPDYAAVVADLRAAGFTVEELPLDTAHLFFAPRGRALRVDGEQVVVFSYPDALAALADTRGITPDGFGKNSATGGMQVSWVARPHFYRRDALVVQYIGDAAALIRRLTALLGAPFAGG